MTRRTAIWLAVRVLCVRLAGPFDPKVLRCWVPWWAYRNEWLLRRRTP
jgi:hypothetical protein